MKKAIWVHLALTLVNVIYAGNYSIAKEVMPDYVQAFGIIVLRVSAASLVFWVWSQSRIKEKIQSRQDWIRLLACALFGVATNQLLFFKGLSYTTPIHASLIMTTTPILVMIASAFILKEHLGWKKGLGILMGFSGALILLLRTHQADTFSGDLTGDLMVFANATSYGIYLVLVKPLMARYKTITVVKWLFLFGFFMVIPFGWEEVKAVDWKAMPLSIYLGLAYIIVGVTMMAYFLNAWALRKVNPSLVGIYIYLQPLLASFIAILVGKDALSLPKLLSAGLIFTGVYLVSLKRKG